MSAFLIKSPIAHCIYVSSAQFHFLSHETHYTFPVNGGFLYPSQQLLHLAVGSVVTSFREGGVSPQVHDVSFSMHDAPILCDCIFPKA